MTVYNKHDDFQPNPGWGFICERCQHRFLNVDGESFPCHKVEWKGKNLISPILVRYTMDGETCNKLRENHLFEEQEDAGISI